jgi:hypothetical protein
VASHADRVPYVDGRYEPCTPLQRHAKQSGVK